MFEYDEIACIIPQMPKGYAITNYGKVVGMPVTIIKSNGVKRFYPIRIIKLRLNDKGYPVFQFRVDGIRKSLLVHRLVALAFVPNHEGLPQVNHLDGCKENNFFMNLEWCTNDENMQHAQMMGLVPAMKGERNGRSKLTQEDVEQILSLSQRGMHYKEIAKLFPVNASTVNKIINHKLWK